jgi:hypothetical protein
MRFYPGCGPLARAVVVLGQGRQAASRGCCCGSCVERGAVPSRDVESLAGRVERLRKTGPRLGSIRADRQR